MKIFAYRKDGTSVCSNSTMEMARYMNGIDPSSGQIRIHEFVRFTNDKGIDVYNIVRQVQRELNSARLAEMQLEIAQKKAIEDASQNVYDEIDNCDCDHCNAWRDRIEDGYGSYEF